MVATKDTKLEEYLIIDSHVHLCDPPYTRENISVTIADGTEIETPLIRANLSEDRLLHDLDESYVDQAIVMGMPFTSNEFLSKVVKDHPNRLMGFAWVTDPKDEIESVRQLTKAINEQGMKGLKLYPSVQGFTAADPEIVPLIRRTVELDVPVLIHSYPYPVGYLHHNLPEHIDVLKKNVPEATIIIGHMGYQRFIDLLALAPIPGIYVETSGALSMITELYGIEFLTRFIRRIGVDNVVYGSDWGAPGSTMKKPLGIIKKMDLTREEKEKILGENIREVLGIQ